MCLFLIFSIKRGPEYRPPKIIVLLIVAPEVVSLILGNPHLGRPTDDSFGKLAAQVDRIGLAIVCIELQA